MDELRAAQQQTAASVMSLQGGQQELQRPIIREADREPVPVS
jgi:hypothetical protein